MLDEDQQTAFDLAKDGQDLVVIGQGGCGKTFLIKQIVNYLRSKGKTVINSVFNWHSFHTLRQDKGYVPRYISGPELAMTDTYMKR
jgi:ABC-type proline/glycine betaine transport system ATPase subunit